MKQVLYERTGEDPDDCLKAFDVYKLDPVLNDNDREKHL